MRAFAALALLVLGLGLPRLVVLCDHGDGTAALEFAHAEGTCCRDHADAEPLAHETGERGGDAHSGGGTCQHRDPSPPAPDRVRGLNGRTRGKTSAKSNVGLETGAGLRRQGHAFRVATPNATKCCEGRDEKQSPRDADHRHER